MSNSDATVVPTCEAVVVTTTNNEPPSMLLLPPHPREDAAAAPTMVTAEAAAAAAATTTGMMNPSSEPPVMESTPPSEVVSTTAPTKETKEEAEESSTRTGVIVMETKEEEEVVEAVDQHRLTIENTPPDAPPPPKKEEPPSTWYLLQPLPSPPPAVTDAIAPIVCCTHQPILRSAASASSSTSPDDPTTTATAKFQSPILLESDRTTRRPSLLRFSITNHQQQQYMYLDVVDESGKDPHSRNNNNNNSSKKGSLSNGTAHNNNNNINNTLTLTASVEKIPNSVAMQRCTALYLQHIESTIQQQQFLYHMAWNAILEECQWSWYQKTMSTNTTTTTTSTGNPVTRTAAAAPRHPFPYYTEAPSTTSTSTTVATTISNSYEQLHQVDLTLTSSVSFTPANIMQRIKQGCTLAHHELQHHHHHTTAATSNNNNHTNHHSNDVYIPRRSSTRIIMNQTAQPTTVTIHDSQTTHDDDPPNRPTVSSSSLMLRTKHGGRVAWSLLLPTAAPTPPTRRRTLVEPKDSDAYEEDRNEGPENMAPAAEDEEEEYVMEPAEEDEEEEDEDVELVPEKVLDDEDNEALMGKLNPYLVPDRFALLEWIGKKGSRTWSTTDLQSIFAQQMVYYDRKLRKKKGRKPQIPKGEKVGIKALDILSTDTDPYIICQLLYEQAQDNPNSTFHTLPFIMSPSLSKHEKIVALRNLLFPTRSNGNDDATKLVVILSAGHIEDIDETIDEWDLPYFSRTQFTLRLLVNEGIQNEILYHVEQQAFQQQEAYKEQRQFESYRYKSIQSGFCDWGVSWLQVANEYVTAKLTDVHTTVTSEEQDRIVAQKLAAQLDAENENTAGESGRRKTRRVGESSGVFYGNQSNLSHKQIMDAFLRLISSSKQPYQTLVGMLHSLPDDSSDPIKRFRTVIGKLLFKRNQLSRMEVQTMATDSEIWNMLQTKLPERSPSDNVPAESLKEAPPVVLSSEENAKESEANIVELREYVRTLQQTELQLRRLVVQNIIEVPIAVVATAGDDRTGSMESMDDVDFEDPNMPISWETEGSPYLSKRIFRPITKDQEVGEETKCYWFTVTGFVPSVVLPTPTTIDQFEKPSIGRAREPIAVERRTRFRAVPSDATPQHELILTEAQICAGMKAAELQLFKQQSTANFSDHPLPSASTPKICLVSIQKSEEISANNPVIEGCVVGHDRLMNSGNGVIENKVLVLPKVGSATLSAFWTTLILPTPGGAKGGITCSVNGNEYAVQQFDFHRSSKAFHACMAIVRFLERHPKCAPFLQPVDPIALGIPDYFNIIKHPMDVSTLLKKLDQGEYAHVPPNFMKGQDSVVRMLNGAFRKDVELIFDNAMLFNPPDDWIHQAASFMKKAVVKKIEQASSSSDVNSAGRYRKKNSLYVDDDSDVDMYAYESDYDDNNNYSRNRKKRSTNPNSSRPSNAGKHSRGPVSEDAPTRAVERGSRIQKMLSDTLGVRGHLSNLPIQSDPSDFSLPSEWTCQYKQEVTATQTKTEEGNLLPETETISSLTTELDELRSLHRLTEESEQMGVRRSTRAVLEQQQEQNPVLSSSSGLDIEYKCPLADIFNSSCDIEEVPRNRLQVEVFRERLHESYFAKLFQLHGKKLTQHEQLQDSGDVWDESKSLFVAEYADGSFPPYLGRVVPMIPLSKDASSDLKPNVKWEIREPFIVPALRWIIRGLLNSEHLVQTSDSGFTGNPLRESILSQSENVLLFPNHIYYINESTLPFDVLDVKEMARRKKQRTTKSTDGDDDSDDDIEMSEYEKARAERMARNKDRLVALGLA